MKKFNITGTCIPEKYYSVDTSEKLDKIIEMIEEGLYFTINRPRQFGKTTILYNLRMKLKNDYLLISTSFEGMGKEAFETIESFAINYLSQIKKSLKNSGDDTLISFINNYKPIKNMDELSALITELVKHSKKRILLMVDEVDKASNESFFLNFLGMLRNKYLNRAEGSDFTFHSVILAGVHDIKNIKLKMTEVEGERKTYNSPWNIAADFEVDLSFSPREIETMFLDYEKENNIKIDKKLISSEIYKFTDGYPFLVSNICKTIDEKLEKDWSVEGVKKAINIIVEKESTLIDDLIKNVENNFELREMIERIIINNDTIEFVHTDKVISLGKMYGIFKRSENKFVAIGNRIFEIILYNHFISALNRTNYKISDYNFRNNFIAASGNLEMEKILLKFQIFIKENYSGKDIQFYEKQGRLLLLAFIKPIINGNGFYYVEGQISYERRMDLVITYNKNEYIVEFKIWHGEEYHKQGLVQLAEYLDLKNQSNGYLVVFNFNKTKTYSTRWVDMNGKRIFEVIV